MEELNALVSRLKAIVTEIEAIISSQPKKKMSKEEYLKASDDEREKYDRENMDKEKEEGEE